MHRVRVVCEKQADRGSDTRRRNLEKEVKPAPGSKRRGPAVNVYESLECFKILFCAPGILSDDFDLQISEDRVVVACHRTAGTGSEDEFRRQERWHGRFRREVRLSSKIRPDLVRAQCVSGLLEIILPKWQQAPLRRVRIGNGDQTGDGHEHTIA